MIPWFCIIQIEEKLPDQISSSQLLECRTTDTDAEKKLNQSHPRKKNNGKIKTICAHL